MLLNKFCVKVARFRDGNGLWLAARLIPMGTTFCAMTGGAKLTAQQTTAATNVDDALILDRARGL